MKTVKTLAALFIVALAFGGGYMMRASKSASRNSGGRTILYYVDPMHPAYRSDKPGIAPDCGMTLEPVYADDPTQVGTIGRAGAGPRPPGTIQVSPERQQLIGVKFA